MPLQVVSAPRPYPLLSRNGPRRRSEPELDVYRPSWVRDGRGGYVPSASYRPHIHEPGHEPSPWRTVHAYDDRYPREVREVRRPYAAPPAYRGYTAPPRAYPAAYPPSARTRAGYTHVE